jgi:starch-binding outer membrane protein, SusD/RagB family
MTDFMTARRTRSGMRTVAAAFAALGLAAGTAVLTSCSPTELLEVESPDIINPKDAQSAAGANAVRVGALARFVQATTGTESLILLGGLMADEWINGDSFIARHEVDRRAVTFDNTFMTTASRNLNRARVSAEQAIPLMDRYLPTAPKWQVAEMYFLLAYLTNIAAEHYCDGLVFSGTVDGSVRFGSPTTTTAAFEEALVHATNGLQLITGTTANDLRIRHALQVTRGRILANLNRHPEAATAVSGVPNNFRYQHFHSAGTYDNAYWSWNNSARRYSVSDREGQNGMNFATAGDPRVPVCTAPCTDIGVTLATKEDGSRPLHVQRLWTNRDATVNLVDGMAARMIEAEAHLRANRPADMISTLNAARATVAGLAPLTDPGTQAAREDLLFRERAFWHFGRGQRFGDLRRLVRQYGRAANATWPTGEWHKAGGTYGDEVTIPVPFAEANNPNVSANQLCMNRNP